MEVTLAGGMSVGASIKGFYIMTDQPEAAGGDNSAPSPFDLFLASIGNCAGFFALRFCQERDISTKGMKLDVRVDRDPETKMVGDIGIDLTLPEGFPEKYIKPILRTMDQCSVKRHLHSPPRFTMTASR